MERLSSLLIQNAPPTEEEINSFIDIANHTLDQTSNSLKLRKIRILCEHCRKASPFSGSLIDLELRIQEFVGRIFPPFPEIAVKTTLARLITAPADTLLLNQIHNVVIRFLFSIENDKIFFTSYAKNLFLWIEPNLTAVPETSRRELRHLFFDKIPTPTETLNAFYVLADEELPTEEDLDRLKALLTENQEIDPIAKDRLTSLYRELLAADLVMCNSSSSSDEEIFPVRSTLEEAFQNPDLSNLNGLCATVNSFLLSLKDLPLMRKLTLESYLTITFYDYFIPFLFKEKIIEKISYYSEKSVKYWGSQIILKILKDEPLLNRFTLSHPATLLCLQSFFPSGLHKSVFAAYQIHLLFSELQMKNIQFNGTSLFALTDLILKEKLPPSLPPYLFQLACTRLEFFYSLIGIPPPPPLIEFMNKVNPSKAIPLICHKIAKLAESFNSDCTFPQDINFLYHLTESLFNTWHDNPKNQTPFLAPHFQTACATLECFFILLNEPIPGRFEPFKKELDYHLKEVS